MDDKNLQHEKINFFTFDHQKIDDTTVDVLLSPVMIVGCPRSGTTWLQRLLLEFNQVSGSQESQFYIAFRQAFISAVENKNARTTGLSVYWKGELFMHQMRELWLRTFISVIENKPQSTVLLEKTPSHALFLDEISSFLPKTRFIHIIRDSRSVVASFNAAAKGWGSYWAPKSTKSAAIEWYLHVQAARSSKIAMNKELYLEIHYEDLLSNPVTEMIKILNFINIPIDLSTIQAAIENQAFSKQKSKGGSGLSSTEGKDFKEPAGFFRKGMADAWKDDLTILQKLIVWRFTRKLMNQCGYNWKGLNVAE